VIDIARRKSVMSRSEKLGHCVCDPQKPCPCDVFIQFNVCQCAGEKQPVRTDKIALTRLVRKAGCASKIGQADLLRVLGNLPPVTDPNVLLGTTAGDDAGVYQIDDGRALVQTVDVFTPCVDDPYLFGQIAAANSLSDVYAMGGKPITALSIIGFPIDTLDAAIMESMLRGGIDKLEEAGCALIGGHSINDDEIKFGFAVTGLMDAGAVVPRDMARPGDVLVLTKPLGTGMIAFAAQLGLVSEACIEETGQWMAMLNKDAAELMVQYGAHACTDITGFALAGHLVEMVRNSGVDAEIDLSAIPVFGLVPECIKKGVFGGGVERNEAYASCWVHTLDGADKSNLTVLYDPQTSGGLLVSLPEAEGHSFVAAMRARGHNAVSTIGRIIEKGTGQPGGRIIVTNTELRTIIGTQQLIDMSLKRDFRVQACEPDNASHEAFVCCETASVSACCDAPPAVEPECEHNRQGENNAMDNLSLFRDFMKEANKPGLIDAQTKKLMAIVLSIAYRCEPCLRAHLQGGVQMGISRDTIDEAAGLAIAFGGCTAMMFYKEMCEKLKL
jgi:selenide,water dikinase